VLSFCFDTFDSDFIKIFCSNHNDFYLIKELSYSCFLGHTSFVYIRIVGFELSANKLDHLLFLNFNNDLPGKGLRFILKGTLFLKIFIASLVDLLFNFNESVCQNGVPVVLKLIINI